MRNAWMLCPYALGTWTLVFLLHDGLLAILALVLTWMVWDCQRTAYRIEDKESHDGSGNDRQEEE